ncbi:MAG: carbon storage regulator [Planctomycetaceae bacterium]
MRIGPTSVRIGIEAPGNLNIVREELCLEEGAVVCAAEGTDEAHRPGYPR